ncbi:MAG TPA: hypothetical protein VKB80_37525 [Kofleriaceae bacterium]|nr:hypothetical protein [Kofleriaceae bacterium]
MSSHFRLSYVALPLLTTLFAPGCVDPKGAFDDFGDRVVDASTAAPDDGGTGGFDGAIPDLTGAYLLSLAATQPAPVNPIRFIVNIDFTAGDSGGTANLTIQPLAVESCAEGMGGMPIGDMLTIPDVSIAANGQFAITANGTTVDGMANPLLCGVPITSDIELTGSLQTAELLCGTVGGHVSAPIEGDLVGTFGAIKLTEPVMFGDANLPAAVTACP